MKNDNKIYKKVIKTVLAKNKKDFCPLRKEHQMDYLFLALKKDFKQKNLRVLEAGCGYGRLIYYLNKFDPRQDYTGIDYMPELLEQGRARFKQKNIHFVRRDLYNMPAKFHKYFDLTISYKTLSWLPGYEEVLKQLVKSTKNKIYVTSLFYDGDIDFITKVYVDATKNSKEYSYLNTYSLAKFKIFCRSLGIKKVKATNMKLDLDLPKPSVKKLRTYTRHSQDGRLEITGTTILNWKLIELTL